MKRLLALITFAAGAVVAQELTLHCARPAKRWSAEALPLANGRLGAMVFGGVNRELKPR